MQLTREAVAHKLGAYLVNVTLGKSSLIKGLYGKCRKVSANPWQDENNGTPRHHGATSDWASSSHHS